MKNVKRFLSLILVSIMVLSMSMPVFAAGGVGSIQITNDQENGELSYEAYQIFKGVVSEGKLTAVEWGDGVKSAELLDELKKEDARFAKCATAADVADVLSGMTDDSNDVQKIASIISKHLGTVAGNSTVTGNVYTISDLAEGYYFVQDASGLAVGKTWNSKYAMILVTENQMSTIKVKTDVPDQEKKVKEDDDANLVNVEGRETYGYGFNDVADYNIGDPVPFELLSKVPNFKGMQSYYFAFDDKMDAGFSFQNDVAVFIGDRKLTPNQDYTVQDPGEDGATFSIVFGNTKGIMDVATEAEIGSTIKVTFSAILNENAKIGVEGNKNASRLRYGNMPGEKGGPTPTEWDYVIVFTYELDVNKKDGEGEDANKLKDAEFVLYREEDDKYVTVNGAGRVTGWVTEKNAASTLKSDENGQFKVIGLDEGVYFLEETKAPKGYNLLDKPVKVEIKADTANGQNYNNGDAALTMTEVKIDEENFQHTTETVGIEQVTVINKSGAELPETGGIGTTLFYIIGALLALGAGVVLVTRRRMQK